MDDRKAENLSEAVQFPGQESRRKMAHIVTFGCQMNQHDSEIVEELLQGAGYAITDNPDLADVILFNTCCVRAHAEQRLYSRVSQLKQLKAQKPDLIVGVGGCVAQREGAALTERFPHIDIIFGTSAVNDIVSLVKRAEHGELPVVATPDDGPALSHGKQGSRRPRAHAWVSVMRGCDNYCAYCVVPYVRGHQRSKAPERVVEEVNTLAETGVIEVTLLGQNVNSYGQDLRADITFGGLLERLQEIPGILRIRFTTSHPRDISTDLMRAIRDLPKVCEHVHLPVQSGSSRILKLMNRGYSSEDYLRKVEMLRELVPDISLTTDVIVGFPGETEEDLEYTRMLMEQAQFDGAYIFKYSARPGTAAVRFDGKLDELTIGRRHRELLEFQKKISLQRLHKLVQTTQSVLAEHGDAKRTGHLIGRTRGHRVASLPVPPEFIGKEIDIRVARIDGWTLVGERLKRD